MNRARSCRGERFQRCFCLLYKSCDILTICFKLSPSRLLCLGTGERGTLFSLGPPEYQAAPAGPGVPPATGPCRSRPLATRRRRARRPHRTGEMMGRRVSGGGDSLLHLLAAAFPLRLCSGENYPLGLVLALQRSELGGDGGMGPGGVGGRGNANDARALLERLGEVRRRGGARQAPAVASRREKRQHFPLPSSVPSATLPPKSNGSACCPQPVRGATEATNPVTPGMSTVPSAIAARPALQS